MKEAYLRSIGARLDCPAKERERLLEQLEDAVSAYLEDAPDAGETELMENFGAPEVCTARLLEECDTAAYLWSNGGLVIIETRANAARPTGQVYYDYDS